MNTERAIQLANEDAAVLREAIRYAKMASMTLGEDFSMILVDGSAVAPSWRAMYGGETVYQASYDLSDDDACDLIMAYEETLDDELDQLSGRMDETVGWEEGSLFLFGKDFDFDQLD